jgi:hypothetical protein
VELLIVVIPLIALAGFYSMALFQGAAAWWMTLAATLLLIICGFILLFKRK